MVNFTLKPGQVTETVEVTTTTPVLETQDASVGQVVNSRNVNNLPLNGRNFTFLAQLSAGVNSPQADTRGNAASGAFAANGSRPAQNNYLLDGIDNNSDTVDFLNGTNFVVLPPVDAIQEFKVQTTNFSAEYRTIRRRGSQRHDQVRHQRLPRRRLGIFPQRQIGCRRLFRARRQHHEKRRTAAE